MTLSSQVLAMLRSREADFLKDTCLIESEALTNDPSNPVEHTRTTVASGVACRLISIGQSVGVGQAIGSVATVDTFRLIVPFGTDLQAGYFVTVSGVEYQIVATMEARTDSTDAQAILARSRGF